MSSEARQAIRPIARNNTRDTSPIVCNQLTGLANQGQAYAEGHGEAQHLLHTVADQGVERGHRNYIEDEAAGTTALELTGIVAIGTQRVGIPLTRQA